MNLKESLELFSLTSLSSPGELKKRYRKLIKIYHPDRHPKNQQWSTRTMQDLNTAYDILNKSLKKSSPSVNDLILRGDEALKNSILRGCLKRTARDPYAQCLRNEITGAADSLNRISCLKAVYFSTLFLVFLRSTYFQIPRPLPAVLNTTKFFHHFSLANRSLDKGIRYFYHYFGNKQMAKRSIVTLSYLDDALGLYSLLIPKTRDSIYHKMIRTRIELSHLFKLRMADPRLHIYAFSLPIDS